MRKWLRFALIFFFFIAGINHFVMPSFYLELIPPYLPFPKVINVVSGVLEILLALLMIFSGQRQKAAWGMITLMILFLPAHIYFIQIGSCVKDGLCVPEWIGWGRLLIVHPLLIYWMYFVGIKKQDS